MRRTFPAPSCSVRGRATRNGFTFLEVVIALALCAILASVVCSSLVTSLRAEQTAVRIYDGNALCDRMLAALYAGASVTDVVASASSAWQVTEAPAITGDVTNRLRWTVWEVSLLERASVRERFALRAQ